MGEPEFREEPVEQESEPEPTFRIPKEIQRLLPDSAKKALGYAFTAKALEQALKEGQIDLPTAIVLSSYLESRGVQSNQLENLLKNASRERLTLPEVILLDSWMERKEAKRNPPITVDTIKQIVSQAIEEKLSKVTTKNAEEMPEWAKQQQQLLEEIQRKLREDEEKKREEKIIEEAKKPVEEFKKLIENQINAISEKIATIEQTLSSQPQKAPEATEELRKVKELLNAIVETASMLGFKKPEESTNPTFSKYQIPIKGSIPAAAIIIPEVIENILNSVEKRLDKILGLFASPPATASQQELIRIPELAPPSIQPEQIKVEHYPPSTQELLPILPKPEEPQKPKIAEPIKIEVALPEKEPIKKETAPPEKEPIKEKKTPPEKPKKTYVCKECGEVFDSPGKLGAHVKHVHRKKKKKVTEAKKEEKTKQTEEKKLISEIAIKKSEE